MTMNPLDSQNVPLLDQVNGTDSTGSPGFDNIVNFDTCSLFSCCFCCGPWAMALAALVVEQDF